MVNMQISFGARIPVSRCNIFSNKDAQRLERATMYEIDCKDEDDFEYVNNVGNWDYKVSICGDISSKYESFKYPSLYTDEDKKYFEKNKFYSIENKNGEVLGLCETVLDGKDLNVEFITVSPKKRNRNIGAALLASVAKLSLAPRQRITVHHPDKSAYGFYDACGFERIIEPTGSIGFAQSRKDAQQNLVKKFEREMQGQIINYNI